MISVCCAAASILINSEAIGRRLDGFGAISGGGATSRLLFSYPQPQLDEILDFFVQTAMGTVPPSLKGRDRRRRPVK